MKTPTEKPQFNYWQLKELDERYAPKDKGGCLSIIGFLLMLSAVNFLVMSTLERLWRLEKSAGIEMTGRQILGLDPDPIIKKLRGDNNQPTP